MNGVTFQFSLANSIYAHYNWRHTGQACHAPSLGSRPPFWDGQRKAYKKHKAKALEIGP